MISVESSLLGGVGVRATCPSVSSRWPDVFGPPTWFVLHTMAENYPERATAYQREACEKFVSGIPVMLPCSSCGDHFEQFMSDWSTLNGSMCTGKEPLKRYLCESHNQIRAASGKALESCCPLNLAAKYATQPLCVPSIPN